MAADQKHEEMDVSDEDDHENVLQQEKESDTDDGSDEEIDRKVAELQKQVTNIWTNFLAAFPLKFWAIVKAGRLKKTKN